MPGSLCSTACLKKQHATDALPLLICLAVQVDLSKTDKLGNVEEAVIGKYAAADDDEEGAASGEDE